MNHRGDHGAPRGLTADTGSLRALREAVAAGSRVSHAVARRAGLGDSELRMLQHLAAGPLGPAALARRLEVTTAASTAIVDRLAARGHVERRPHASDRRRTEVSVTASGRAEVLAHLRPTLDALAHLDAGFSADERAVVERYLRAAARVFDDAAAPPAAPASPSAPGSPTAPTAPGSPAPERCSDAPSSG